MKLVPIFILVISLCNGSLYSQVAINEDGSAPNSSAMLEVKSDSKGFLLPRLSDEDRDLIPEPAEGLIIYNTTTKKLNFFSGSNWYEITNSTCVPQPSVADAGDDQYTTSGNLTLTLNAATPQSGTGTWSIISGTGGSFEDIHDPGTQFYAVFNESYQLRWTVSTNCGNTTDDINIIPTSYSHTITIDGTNDFIVADEQFATTSIGYYSYFSWDSDYLYIGYEGSAIGSSISEYVLCIYLDSLPPTTSTGMIINSQQPQLPFGAKYLVSWRADNVLLVYSYNGSSWGTSNLVSSSDYSINGNYIEFRISLTALGNPTSIKVHGSMLYTAALYEWTFAGAPHNSFTDGYDPDYIKYYQFSFLSGTLPNQYTPLP